MKNSSAVGVDAVLLVFGTGASLPRACDRFISEVIGKMYAYELAVVHTLKINIYILVLDDGSRDVGMKNVVDLDAQLEFFFEPFSKSHPHGAQRVREGSAI